MNIILVLYDGNTFMDRVEFQANNILVYSKNSIARFGRLKQWKGEFKNITIMEDSIRVQFQFVERIKS